MARFALCPAFVDHRLRNVVEEVDERLERSIGRTTVAQVLFALCLGVSSIPPPLIRRLAGRWDHRIDQHEQRDAHPLAHEGRDEAPQRLRDEHDAFRIPLADRPDDGRRVIRKAGPVIRRRQLHRDRLVAARPELRRHQMPVRCAPARAGHEDERVAPHHISRCRAR